MALLSIAPAVFTNNAEVSYLPDDEFCVPNLPEDKKVDGFKTATSFTEQMTDLTIVCTEQMCQEVKGDTRATG